MGQLFSRKLVLFFPAAIVLLCVSCSTKKPGTAAEVVDTAGKPAVIETKQLETKPEIAEKKPKEAPVFEAPAEPSNVVAKTGDYVITRGELEKRLMDELRPERYEEYGLEAVPVDAKTVLMTMIAEKAMVMEARKQNYAKRKMIRTWHKQFREKKLISMLLRGYLKDKVKVTDSEIDEKIKANPKMDRNRTRMMLERQQANKLVDEYYSQLCKKFHVQKVSENISKAAEIHQRLLLHPKEQREAGFIRIDQVENDLTSEEKKIALAVYDGGKVTLKDWFDALFEMAPPSRPKDLGTPEGVERLLDRSLNKPVFVAEAKSVGLDKDENYLKQVRENEDSRLLSAIRYEVVKDIKEPTDEEQIIAYFSKNKELFGTSERLKIDQIWFKDLKEAEKAKTELDSGKDFESVRQQYSSEQKGKTVNTYPGKEGVFFKDLWKADPNEIVGPVKGFQREGVKWRIAKILEKKSGEVKEYSSNMQNSIKRKMYSELTKAAMEKYQKELLEKYPYEIYADRIKNIDPLDIR